MTVATLYDWFLFLHILAAMTWVGGGIMLGALGLVALRSGDPGTVGRFIRSLRIVGPRVLAPATLAVVGLGVWMVLKSAAWDFGQAWVATGLALFAAAFAIGAAHQSQAALHAERALERQDHGEALRQLRRWSLGYGLIVLLLVVAAWDMVFKPGL